MVSNPKIVLKQPHQATDNPIYYLIWSVLKWTTLSSLSREHFIPDYLLRHDQTSAPCLPRHGSLGGPGYITLIPLLRTYVHSDLIAYSLEDPHLIYP